MTALTYTRGELLRAFRDVRFFVFSLAFPVVMFLLIAGPNRREAIEGVPLPVYFMAGMAAWGTMIAVMGAGGRIAADRQAGWHRQLRITPMPTRVYFRAKVLTGYLMGLLTIAALAVAGTFFGVRLSAGQWATMVALIVVGLVPFAVLGVLLGHLLTPDSLGPAMGGIGALFAIFGGAWGPIAPDGFLHDLARFLPSYWLVQAGHTAVGGEVWPAQGWAVVALWTAVLVPVAAVVYRRDTQRT